MGAFPTRGAFQVDGWGQLKVGVAYAALTGQVKRGTAHAGEWRLLGIYYQDWRRILKTDNRPPAVRRNDLANIRIGTFGGHYLHVAATPSGPLDLMLWGVWQTGRFGLLDHRSQAVDFELGWQPKILPRLKPWLRGGYYHGGGDSNPGDNRHETFFQILPTPRPFARTPFYDMVNNEDFLGMLILRPHKAVTVRSEFHALRMANRNDLWYAGGGAFQPWSFGYIGRATGGARSLANLYDTSVDWSPNAHVTLTGYLGYMQGRAAIRNIYPQGHDGSFGYLEFLYRF
jgi:hypothetical protein